jgi:hypothetical protein
MDVSLELDIADVRGLYIRIQHGQIDGKANPCTVENHTVLVIAAVGSESCK